MIVDLSADYRFDDSWYYGLPELYRGNYHGQRHISNPGCYATAMHLAIAPMKTPRRAAGGGGVSGYSGAGTTPSDRTIRRSTRQPDSMLLVDHTHEREVRHLGFPVNSYRTWRRISVASR